MRSKRCAVQNQGTILSPFNSLTSSIINYFFIINLSGYRTYHLDAHLFPFNNF